MKEIIDIVHKSIYPFFDVCENEEEPLSDKDKLLLKVNKAICNNLKALKQEPKTGHWIYLKNERKSVVQAYKCSVCGWEIDSCRGLMQDTGHRLFCEHCGAKMIDSQERSDKE